jgi:RNA polymerase sigma-70 factor (ECF subfamily)
MADSKQPAERLEPRVFATTHWSVVLAAGNGKEEQANTALEKLCAAYWYPIYVYVRRKGYGPEDAQDLTQEFFFQVIAKDRLRLADQNKGKFRNFLLGVLDHFVAHEWSRAHRQKRGGNHTFLSLDQDAPEDRYRLEPVDHETPEKNFERQWALTMLDLAMKALEAECMEDGKAALFAEVKGLLSGERDPGAYMDISQRLGMSEAALRVAVHRLRRRYGELLRAEVAHTVATAGEIEEEMRSLVQLLSK